MSIQPAEHVMHRRLGDRIVLINLQTNDIYDLNETAARFWELLAAGGTLSGIEAQLASEYDVDAATLADELKATLSMLAENSLIAGYDGR